MKPTEPSSMIEAPVGSLASRVEPQMPSTVQYPTLPTHPFDMTSRCCLQTSTVKIQNNPAQPLLDGTNNPGHFMASGTLDGYPVRIDRERKRDKAKRFAIEKGPRIVGAAATIAMFVFNIVFNCC
jgi:hypothetical protein